MTLTDCFHCGLKIPLGQHFELVVLEQNRFFCCAGCLAIAETICHNQLQSFYQFRTENNLTALPILPQELLDIEALDAPSVLASISYRQDNCEVVELGIEGITCAACGWLIRKNILQLPEVIDIQVNTTNRRAILKLHIGSKVSPVLKNIRQLGYTAYPFSEDQQEALIQQQDKAFIRRLIVAGLAMMQIMMLAVGLYIGEYQDISEQHAYFLHWISALLATPVVFYSAMPFFISAWNGLKQKSFGMNLPVSIAVIAGYSASVYSLLTHSKVYYFDSVVMFVFFLLIGRYFEHRMRLKAILKQQNFKRLIPTSATRQTAQGNLESIPTDKIKPDDLLLIAAGNVIPVDGVLVSEKAEINEAVVSGEFLPIAKIINEKLYSGSTNIGGSINMRATSDTTNCRIQQLIQLQSSSENICSLNTNDEKQSIADRVANGYVIGLLILCLFTWIFWWYVDPTRVFPIVLSLLIVSCPCALSLATPAAVAATIAQLTDRGLMIKTRDSLTRLEAIDTVCFDKTGTLTLGKMTLATTVCVDSVDEFTCLSIAKSLEAISNHPIAHAFKSREKNLFIFDHIQEVIAGGIEGVYAGDTYRIGNVKFALGESNRFATQQNSKTNQLLSELTIYLSKNNQHIASFILTDEINPTAKNAVALFHKMGVTCTLISGDSQMASDKVADYVKIQQVYANQTPEQKLAMIKDLRSNGKVVLMVGDGVNDIGALNQADVGITLGVASHLSKSISNAVLLSTDLGCLAESVILSRKLKLIIKQNLGWAIVYNLIAVPFAVAGLVPAWLAAIGMTSSSLIVVLNSLRLRR